MIRKVQKKFVLASMTAFLLVLAVIISAINIVNYNQVVREADSLLEILGDNQGTFPQLHDKERPDMDGRPGGLWNGLSPEIPYESRYFSVTLNVETGNVVQAETSRIISVDTAQAIEYAKEVFGENRSRGFVDDFRYVVEEENENARIIFLDCGRKIGSFYSFLLASIAISLAGYLVVFALIAYFSGRIIRPISESYEKQKQFITNAGHEIKTPLTIIHADVDVLEMEFGENEWLEDIQKQTGRLSELTRSLVYLARMEEEHSDAPMIEFPFSDVVGETAASFQALAQTQDKSFDCRVTPMLTLKGDERAIRQLVSVLLDNAVKYSPAGGAVALAAEKQNGGLLLSVRNTTEHEVPEDSLPRLFDRFYRVDPSRNSQTGGYGIGLSVAQAIVTAHGGKIKAVKDGPNALCITVWLPT